MLYIRASGLRVFPATGRGQRLRTTMDDLSPESRAHCESALDYIEDMSAWYDEDVEGAPKGEFVRRILKQIEYRGEITPSEARWVEKRLGERYGETS
jgi:hypothetical protein